MKGLTNRKLVGKGCQPSHILEFFLKVGNLSEGASFAWVFYIFSTTIVATAFYRVTFLQLAY
jgi:hypothetical protein